MANADAPAPPAGPAADDPSERPAPLLVVGMGASAGGVEAFKAFFTHMPDDCGMAFVLVQHLDPAHDSALPAIVSNATSMAVRVAQDGAVLAPNTIHIIPPNTILTVRQGALRLDSPASPAARRVSVNTFLASLAEDQGEDAVGIILSGFGSDGALGASAIKEHGGLTLGQAEFDHHAKSGMPQSAASGGFVDHVLKVEEMPAALLNYQRHRTIFDAAKREDGIRQDLPSRLSAICAVLNGRLGRDFSQYKGATLMRRIQRRMHVLQIDEASAYIDRLRSSPNEAELLFRELLISVTRFFRDPEAFGALEATVIPAMLAGSPEDQPIRVWVPGCATGEEAYSIAILLREAQARGGQHRRVQIFATDIDDRAIEAARLGVYERAIAVDVSEARLERDFLREDGHYRVAKELREMCLFSTHDLVKDPPFSKLDLVSCRNLMIYFEPALQQRVLTTFHYALRPGGRLFLGPSESVTVQSRLFEPIDKRHRLYAREDSAVSFPVVLTARAGGPSPPKRETPAPIDELERRAARAMAAYAPAFLVVDHRHDVMRFSGQTTRFLEPTGVASLNLFSLLNPDLRAAARAALRQVAQVNEAMVQEGLIFRTEGRDEVVNLIVEPLSNGEETVFVVAFQQVGRGDREGSAAAPDDEGSNVAVLQRELSSSRERLRNTSEQLEAANEELQSSNEEYLSINEELQSTNEELETSKEELQSLNEELQTINAELSNRNENLTSSNSDLNNLFDSTAIATLFLDNSLNIRRFTPRLLEIFNVREGDEGRPISDIVSRLTREGLAQNVREVLRTFQPIEREVEVQNGASYLMQVRPYRGLNNVVDGAVVTFVDISERKQGEQARSQLAAIVEFSQDAIVSHDLAGVVATWNSGAEQLYGYASAEAVGRPLIELLGGMLPDAWPAVLERLRRGERIEPFDGVRVDTRGRSIDVAMTISPLLEPEGRVVGASVIARDISERRAAEEKATLLLGELDHRVKNILQIVSAVVRQTMKTADTPQTFAAEVEGRIRAIAAAHSLLTQRGLGEMSLRAVVETELAPYRRGGRRDDSGVAIEGPDVALAPRAGMSLAMAVHELASNAAKYGALSTPEGRLSVSWAAAGEPGATVLTLHWAEAGGPPVKPPGRRGFGTTLIERTLTHELDAMVRREFAPAGVECTVVLPLAADVGRLKTSGGGGADDVDPR